MEKLFETALFTRTSMLKILEKMPRESLVRIPENFRNSIFWNIAHVMVTQQLLFYKLSGQALKIDETFVPKYAKGSVPDENIDGADILYVKENLVESMKIAHQDFKNGHFQDFSEYPTSTGIILKNIDDAISFNAYHDGIHLGIVLSLMKIV
jgi:predicted GNAT family acetyltransferase